MKLKKYKNYLSFAVSTLLFILIIAYSVILYAGWDNDLGDGADLFEVNLPIIDWQKYTNLSKQYEEGIIEEST